MFTLKLYRHACPTSRAIHKKVLAVSNVLVYEIGEEVDYKYKALELIAVSENGNWETYYIGEPSSGMEAYGKNNLHLGSESGTWWGWGLLENSEGKTTEHYRPASYG